MTRTTRLDREALASRLTKQHNVIARDQAMAVGMTAGALRHRLRPGGAWQELLSGVYLAVTGTPTTVQKEIASLLYAGPGSLLTGLAALRRHGVTTPPSDTFDVLVPATCQRGSTGFVRLRRTTRVPQLFCCQGPIRFVMPARAVADTVRNLATARDARAVVASAVQRRRCTVELIAQELDEGARRGSRLLRGALHEIADGVRSAAEGDLHDLIKRAKLPVPMLNPRLYLNGEFIAEPDQWWPEAGVATEVDSREYHLSPDDWQRTMERHARMSSVGIIVLHFTPAQIRNQPGEVTATIRRALCSGQERPPLPVDARPATG
jgi:hypothetical protein